MNFRVGQKVVCIDATDCELSLSENAIYTITSIRHPYLRVDCKPGLGIFGDEVARGYYSTRFRPIVERKTDISIFTRMLTDKKIGADA
jgi:hypothetical protein